MRALGVIAALAVLGAVAILALRPESGAGNTRTFRSDVFWDVSFRYPSHWHRGAWQNGSTMSMAVSYLSTDPMHDPCRRTTDSQGMAYRGRKAPRALRPGGVYVSVTRQGGWFGGSLDDIPGHEVRIADRPAKVTVERPGDCRLEGVDETMTATIGRINRFMVVQACLRGPNLARSEEQVLPCSTRSASTNRTDASGAVVQAKLFVWRGLTKRLEPATSPSCSTSRRVTCAQKFVPSGNDELDAHLEAEVDDPLDVRLARRAVRRRA